MSLLRRTLLQAASRPAPSTSPTAAACQRMSFAVSSRRPQTESALSIEAQIAAGPDTPEAKTKTNGKAKTDTPDKKRPRWSYTPERMKAPFPLYQPKDPRRSAWSVNEDPVLLDRMYERFLGRELTRTMPDELKWLAVTHKSFDNGRRGFNTRLAYYGRMVVVLETTKMIMVTPAAPGDKDHYGRTPFTHPALEMVDRLDARQPADVTEPKKLAALAQDFGLQAVMRWKPRMPENLAGSGIDTAAATSLFAIIGAVSLQYGGAAAAQIVRERLLKKLME